MTRKIYRAELLLPAAIFFTCLLYYALFWTGNHYSIDGVVMFENAKSILFQGSFVMDPPVSWFGMEFRTSQWGPGLTLVYVPVLALLSLTIFQGRRDISQIPYDPRQLANPVLEDNMAYRYSSAIHPILTAMTAAGVYILCRMLGLSRWRAAAASLIFGIASPAAVYAKYDFSQPLVSLCILAAVIFLLAARSGSHQAAFLAGLALGMAILTRIEMTAIPTLPLLALSLLPSEFRRKNLFTRSRIRLSLLFFLPIAVLTAVTLHINILRASGQLSIGYSNPGAMITLRPAHLLLSTAGNLFSPGRGVLLFFPLLLFSILGLAALFRQNWWKGILLTIVTAGFLLMYAGMTDWGAGISWGPRFLIPAFPYLSVLAVIGFEQAERKNPTAARIGFILLAALGWTVTLPGQLISFLNFYSFVRLETGMIVRGLYHFSPRFSPIFTGWQLAVNPVNWDLYWIRDWAISSGKWIAMPILAAINLSLFASWMVFFRKKSESVAA